MSQKYHKKCICEYDGTNYAGWQAQEGLITVQQAIETSLFTLYGEKIRITGSGRTDSGVHALGQVFHYSACRHRDNYSILHALNSTLSRDISVLGVEDAPAGFHAQFSAVSKTYKYVILNRAGRASLDRNRAWYRRTPIDESRLSEILKKLEGKHDFTSFCVQKSIKPNCVRVINFIDAVRNDDYITITVNANGFLHNMIRIIVGTAVNMFYNNTEPDEILNILAAKNREAAGITAPAQGLYLVKVFY